MMDLTRWLRLFEIDPELKPPGLEHNPGGVAAPKDPDGAMTLPVWTIHCDGVTIDPEPGDEWKQDGDDEPELVVIIPNHAAAALIRDRAVWRLAEKMDAGVVLAGDETGMCLKIVRTPITVANRQAEWCFMNSNPTEALYLACCKVLEVEP